AILSMERGTLSEEYREGSSSAGTPQRNGPYFKHQCWENSRNRSRRVPLHEVATLRDDLENAQLFDQLVAQLAALNIAQSRQRRGNPPQLQQEESGTKRNSKSKASGKATAKPRPSWRRSRSASSKKGSKA
ncbi:MAG TPA: hypothetical protein VMN36_09300, partial [Verrucomicrobiales bacterium]|nr:hypothetical protein [Verrucomicrobiales bacterium]